MHPSVILNIYLVDVVSGTVVFAMNHRRVKGPIQIVHSENWLVYSFYNEKIRRNEISKCILELVDDSRQILISFRGLSLHMHLAEDIRSGSGILSVHFAWSLTFTREQSRAF